MKGAVLVLLCSLCPVALAMAAGVAHPASSTTAQPAPAQSTIAVNRHEVSYAIGYRLGSEFANGHPKVNLPTLVQALKDAYAQHPPAVPMVVMQQQLQALGAQMRHQALVTFHKLAVENAQKSAAFMRNNRRKAGVVSLPSGVEYKIIKVGHGASPTLSSTVVMNYRGSLVNGMQFDSTLAHGKPVTYAVSKMLPGWRDVLPRMRAGAHWKVFIPPQQAYGERGELPRIGPNEALVFDIQLLGVKH